MSKTTEELQAELEQAEAKIAEVRKQMAEAELGPLEFTVLGHHDLMVSISIAGSELVLRNPAEIGSEIVIGTVENFDTFPHPDKSVKLIMRHEGVVS